MSVFERYLLIMGKISNEAKGSFISGLLTAFKHAFISNLVKLDKTEWLVALWVHYVLNIVTFGLDGAALL